MRKEEEPILDPPRRHGGITAWLLDNLFSSVTNAVLTILGLALLVWIIPPIVRWAFIDAVWTGDNRDACLAPEAGACWIFVKAKFAQFMYGRYPIEERWRVDLTGILLIIGLVPLAIPRAPFKRANILYLGVIFPVVALILLTGGAFRVDPWLVGFLIGFACLATAAIAMMSGAEAAPFFGGFLGPVAALLAIAAFVASYFVSHATLAEYAPSLAAAIPATVTIAGATLPILDAAAAGLAILALLAGILAIAMTPGLVGAGTALSAWVGISGAVFILALLAADFGLKSVETPLWGGLLITLVVAIVGIVGSMPLGIVLALGRRSKLPVVRMVCIVFIEFVRGVPLITVLFMASVMLPLFLPPGVNFDKLLRALIGVTLFSGAYMAEVVRGGLQAIPKGQYEAAHALGLNYWKTMRLIILPQALKIVIPGIVNSFISLFKDTSLVLIIGIFDLLGIVQFNFTDPNWASPKTPATGYVFAALVFWLFCFGMSRYSIYTERRLYTGHRR
ncbi:MAG TPA: amino acid ABC transporter permease [Bauldia sp.]|nr:amino acid ABC transporter permease [Bauldia sp.]